MKFGNSHPTRNDINRLWYHDVCTNEEIDRILNVQNAEDYLLKLRADTIADDIRLWRVFLNMAKTAGGKWSLERYFKPFGYDYILKCLNPEHRNICSKVTYGAIITSDPNGLIFESDYGICSTYSVAIRYFSFFSSLALLELGEPIPLYVRLNAMRIAIRTMLQKETLDFEVDPRGIIPSEMLTILKPLYIAQIGFIAAHEYSHLINGDLRKGETIKLALIQSHFKNQTDYKMLNAYTSAQHKEFKADIGAMTYPLMSKKQYSYHYFATMMWFASLAIYEAAENYIFPPNGRQTHPGAKARYNNLLENAPRPTDFDEEFYIKDLPELVSWWEEVIIEDVSENFECYEVYGSTYLNAPDTKWRGKKLIDRIDY